MPCAHALCAYVCCPRPFLLNLGRAATIPVSSTLELPKWAKMVHHVQEQPASDPWNVLHTLRTTQLRRAAETLKAQERLAKKQERPSLLTTLFARCGLVAWVLVC